MEAAAVTLQQISSLKRHICLTEQGGVKRKTDLTNNCIWYFRWSLKFSNPYVRASEGRKAEDLGVPRRHQKKVKLLDMMTQACNPNTRETETGRLQV